MRLTISGAAAVAVLSLATLACHRQAQAPSGAAPAPSRSATTYSSGDDLIGAMHARYVGKWYPTISFVQKTSRLQADGSWNAQTWYEAGHFPGRLRIDFDPISAGNGVLYARDSTYVVQNGRSLRGAPGINPLLLLGFDVYAQSPARTATLLRREGFDLTQVHPDTFQGRPMIVVGAAPGDMRRKQFWVDADRLYFVRILEPTPRDSTQIQDIRFLNYEPRGEAWVSPRVEIHTDGKLVFTEDYSDIKTNVPLDAALFDPAKWKSARHWAK
jgi:hypothetical protein